MGDNVDGGNLVLPCIHQTLGIALVWGARFPPTSAVKCWIRRNVVLPYGVLGLRGLVFFGFGAGLRA